MLPTPMTTLEEQLNALSVDALLRPTADPHAAAITALLAADFLDQPEARAGGDAVDEASAKELAGRLRTLARAILHALDKLGGDWFHDGKTPDIGDLREDGRIQKMKMLAVISRGLDDAEGRLWVEAIERGEGDIDLLVDLRALTWLYQHYKETLPKTEGFDADDEGRADKLADRIEAAFTAGEAKSLANVRDSIARTWTLFVPTYDEACKLGRQIVGEGLNSAKFPPLATLSRSHKSRKGGAGPSSTSKPESLRPGSSRRAQPRYNVEMEVGVSSESNFYMGFTENLSATGVFVATYKPRPIGSRIEVTLTLPNSVELKVMGTVRWTRGESSGGDSWPGMGIQFDGLSAEEEKIVSKFLRLRDPLFYDE